VPSARTLNRVRERWRGLTSTDVRLPPPAVIGRVNRFLSGWGRCFGLGYPGGAFQKVNWFLQIRFRGLLRTRSQRRGRLSGPSLYAALREKGLIYSVCH